MLLDDIVHASLCGCLLGCLLGFLFALLLTFSRSVAVGGTDTGAGTWTLALAGRGSRRRS
jgi:NhaP-type Na+/H+ or K+/H+ antiporter